MRLNSVKNDSRCSRITILCKTIRYSLHQSPTGYFIGIDIHFTELAERSQIINTSNVIVMNMGKQHCINLAERQTQHLLTEIRPRVN